jgi:gamma-butyrobetaine dioxygenase
MPSQATRPPLVGMPAVWLRDNCPCPLCRDPVSGQRRLHITDIPADIAVAEVVPSVGTVSVLFHPDGHRAVFDRDWLARCGEPARGGPPDPRTEDAKRLWSAADLGGEPPRGSWPRYLADPGYRRACQSAILAEGLLLLSDVPTDPGSVLAVAASLGYVRETNYGRLFDVRVESSPSNLAFTSLPIPPHTDNPYRDPVPTVQLLQSTELSATRPLVSLDARGRIREIRINPRSLQPVRLPGPGSPRRDAGTCRAATRISMASSRPWPWENVRERVSSAGRTGHDSS